MNLDKNNQPLNSQFNFSRNKDKAVYALKGILDGITADQKLNELEVLFLDIWLREQSALERDGDVVDLLELIGDCLSDGVITSDELAELRSLIKDILDYKTLDSSSVESSINEFVGLLSGVVSDNTINDAELSALIAWLNSHPEVHEQWPVSEISKQLSTILEDGVVTPDEREHLLEVIKQITGVRFTESGVAYGMATEFFEDPISALVHENSEFCFTGTFVTGSRKAVTNTAVKKGATVKTNVTRSLNYLVIGTLASRDWRFSSHGRKIEKALALKQSGHPVVIITERTWLKHL